MITNELQAQINDGTAILWSAGWHAAGAAWASVEPEGAETMIGFAAEVVERRLRVLREREQDAWVATRREPKLVLRASESVINGRDSQLGFIVFEGQRAGVVVIIEKEM